jgi:hypothetical protein
MCGWQKNKAARALRGSLALINSGKSSFANDLRL